MFMKKKIVFIFCVLLLVCFLCLFKVCNFNSNTLVKEVIYNGNNLKISIDGNSSETLPTSGNYYLATYDCKSSDTILQWNRDSYTLDVSNSNKKGGVSCYLNFQSTPRLSDMSAGSYVKYIGNNGCDAKHCEGYNANYVNDEENRGYCNVSSNIFKVNGWRIAYSKDNSAYLISAGAPECMCTGSDGVARTSCSGYESTGGIPQHLANLNAAALKYCNKDYAYNGVCDSNSGWNINDNDFQTILKAVSRPFSTNVSLKYCSAVGPSRPAICGGIFDIINNGGIYWFGSATSTSSNSGFYWRFYNSTSLSGNVGGVRPVLRLQSSVIVTGGSGTYEDPFTIDNISFSINGGSEYINASQAKSVTLTLGNATNVSKMCISVDSMACSNYINYSNSYNLDFSILSDGKKTVYVYYKDGSGKIVASMNRSIILDKTAPTNNSVSIGDGNGLSRVLTIFSSGASKMCFSNTSNSASNCTNWVDYATSYSWSLTSGTGIKTVYAFFKDDAGNISSTSANITISENSGYSVNEDFNDETFDSKLTVTGIGNYPWVVSNGRFQSNNVGINSTVSSSQIQFTPTSDATLSFDYGVFSETNFDKFTVTLYRGESTYDILVNAVSGISSSSVSNISLSKGTTYILELSFSKDSSGSNSSDLAYISNLKVQS